MIVTFEPGADDAAIEAVLRAARRFPGVSPTRYDFSGASVSITEVHLVGQTRDVPVADFEHMPGVHHVVRVSTKYRLIGRHERDGLSVGFEYNGVAFDEASVKLFAGLCAVDTPQHVDAMMAALAREGIVTTRMGAYKPRTSPYDFQGLGAECLPWVFEAAGRHGIKVIAMEVTNERNIDEIRDALDAAGRPTGVMLQIGTRNAQNFELLKSVGQQREMPALVKRGMGVTLEETLNACEYIASEGNPNIVLCLRGVKSSLGDPHRNLVDFAHVPTVRRLTRLPVCVDPSHSVGGAHVAPDGLPEVFHAAGQGVLAGATLVLIDFHPDPPRALCDGPQAMTLDRLPVFKRYVERVREAYEAVVAEATSAAPTRSSPSRPARRGNVP